MMAADFLASFAQLVAARTGVRIASLGDRRFQHQLRERVTARADGNSAAYLALLGTGTPESRREWDHLVPLITNAETFFFRDRGQFTLLKEKILPELIERGRARRSLRVWSAGCSTGEEPYSLAILLDELLPLRDDWDLWILGTDLNPASLERAREGRYGRWSFRLVPPDLLAKYFRPDGDQWELDPRIRRMVTFRFGNLAEDFAGCGPADRFRWDLILCRNVFLYFDEPRIAAVMAQFRDLLRPDGYLMTGHNEAYPLAAEGLAVRSFSDSALFQRQDEPERPRGLTPPPPARPSRHQAAHPAAMRPAPPGNKDRAAAPDLSEARALLRRGLADEATAAAERILARHPHHLEALRLMAQACANAGRHQEAARYCRRVLARHYADVPAHFLLAKIAEEQGDLERAQAALEKTLYLDPSFIPAHLELAFLHDQAGRRTLARNQFQAAADLLKPLPAATQMEWLDDLPAGELLTRITGLLDGRTAGT